MAHQVAAWLRKSKFEEDFQKSYPKIVWYLNKITQATGATWTVKVQEYQGIILDGTPMPGVNILYLTWRTSEEFKRVFIEAFRGSTFQVTETPEGIKVGLQYINKILGKEMYIISPREEKILETGIAVGWDKITDIIRVLKNNKIFIAEQ